MQERRSQAGGGKDCISAVERNNLVAVAALVVRAVVEASLRFGRQLDQESIVLHQLFVVLELCLRHGLKQRRLSLLQGRRELWEILQLVERWASEAQEITSTARDLSIVRTNAGRARAWLRLATMQKKLGDYVKVLVEQREMLLAEYYELHRGDEQELGGECDQSAGQGRDFDHEQRADEGGPGHLKEEGC